jgi:hypothetical protein
MLVMNLEAEIQLLDDGPRGLVDWLEERIWNWHLLISNEVGESSFCPRGRRRVRLC